MKHQRDVPVIVGIHVSNGQEPNVFHGAAIEGAVVALMHEPNPVFFGRNILHQKLHVHREKHFVLFAIAIWNNEDEFGHRHDMNDVNDVVNDVNGMMI
jgi:hypothetical protein